MERNELSTTLWFAALLAVTGGLLLGVTIHAVLPDPVIGIIDSPLRPFEPETAVTATTILASYEGER